MWEQIYSMSVIKKKWKPAIKQETLRLEKGTQNMMETCYVA
jgi:hypothetical protein